MKTNGKMAALALGAIVLGMSLRVVPTIAQDAAKKVAAEIQWRPTGNPDRIILTFAGDPARTSE